MKKIIFLSIFLLIPELLFSKTVSVYDKPFGFTEAFGGNSSPELMIRPISDIFGRQDYSKGILNTNPNLFKHPERDMFEISVRCNAVFRLIPEVYGPRPNTEWIHHMSFMEFLMTNARAILLRKYNGDVEKAIRDLNSELSWLTDTAYAIDILRSERATNGTKKDSGFYGLDFDTCMQLGADHITYD